MKIGITYDTKDRYDAEGGKQTDSVDIQSILFIKMELEKLGHNVTLLGNVQRIMDLLINDTIDCDIVYNTVEGISSRNREGTIPALLETYNIPYIGTDAFGLCLAFNKYLTKVIAQYHGIKTPKCVLIPFSSTSEETGERLDELNFPVILKPNYGENSSEVSVCYSKDDAVTQIQDFITQYQTDILCEEFIFGLEISVPYIDTKPEALWDVTTVDVQKRDEFGLDTKGKQSAVYRNLTVDAETKAILKRYVTTLFKTIGCRDFCRFDFLVTSDNEVFFIGANPLPALGKGSSFDVVAKKYGYTYVEMLQLIIEAAGERLSIPII